MHNTNNKVNYLMAMYYLGAALCQPIADEK